jgi:carbon-monoxide dehydrogenase medium subunit
MERRVGNLRVRTMGSIGGNLSFADPHSDPATFLLAAGGQIEARRGEADVRTIDPGEFVVGPYQNALTDGELLAAVLVPKLAPGAVLVHRKISFHERPAVTISCHLRPEGGSLSDVRIAVGSAGVVPARARKAEEMLRERGPRELQPDPAGDLGRLVADAADPVEDANGSVEYKRHLVGVLAQRCVASALSQAGA